MILLTGATGYIGGRLIGPLELTGCPLRCMVRRPEALAARVAADTEVVRGDVLDAASVAVALEGVDTAYYLVHSMGTGGRYAELDREAAQVFANAARSAGVSRIIFLGGLGEGSALSAHLSSRQEVGRILRDSGVQTIEFRAAVIIGSGSISFEMIRALVDELPVILAPRWVKMLTQPIAIEDVLAYLVAALGTDVEGSHVFRIGGADRVSYGSLMLEYARQRGLRRVMVPMPLFTPRLSSYWLALFTPLYARIGHHLIEGLRNETVVTDDAALRAFPQIHPRGMREAIERALAYEDRESAETRWSDALFEPTRSRSHATGRFGHRFVDSRIIHVPCSPAEAFRPILCAGGEKGWYAHDWLWGLRGLLDQVTGGVGLRRGRRDPTCLLPGETLDFWRVEAIDPYRMLRLSAEMKVPGRAWLVFEVEPDEAGSTIRQTAILDPRGLAGYAYWYGLWPVHQLVFRGLIRGIAREAQGHRAAAR